jgi:hypothetical protein
MRSRGLSGRATVGPLDLLGAIEDGRGYDELAATAVVVELNGHPVPILELATLAERKRGATSPKDRLTLAILEETLRRRGT